MKQIKTTAFVDKCPHCGKEIKGTTEEQVRYNLRIHTDAKHGRELRR